jgi:hypothetical protein
MPVSGFRGIRTFAMKGLQPRSHVYQLVTISVEQVVITLDVCWIESTLLPVGARHRMPRTVFNVANYPLCFCPQSLCLLFPLRGWVNVAASLRKCSEYVKLCLLLS